MDFKPEDGRRYVRNIANNKRLVQNTSTLGIFKHAQAS